jgi:hypothetical protein
LQQPLEESALSINDTRQLTIFDHGLGDHFTCSSIHGEHIMVDSTNLRIKVTPNRAARSNIRLHDVANDLDSVSIPEDLGILISLLYD